MVTENIARNIYKLMLSPLVIDLQRDFLSRARYRFYTGEITREWREIGFFYFCNNARHVYGVCFYFVVLLMCVDELCYINMHYWYI